MRHPCSLGVVSSLRRATLPIAGACAGNAGCDLIAPCASRFVITEVPQLSAVYFQRRSSHSYVLLDPQASDPQMHMEGRLMRRCSRLEGLIRRLSVPAARSVFADGHAHSLPIRTRSNIMISPEFVQDAIAYCAGFFDGDGCVGTDRKFGRLVLTVEQGTANVQVLFFFRDLFGGGIYSGKVETGFSQSTLVWKIGGDAARSAAEMLSQKSLIKHQQLVIASSKAPAKAEDRLMITTSLRELKRIAPPFKVVSSWNYVAGFFDAEGCIHVGARNGILSLIIGQKHQQVLLAIKSFLLDNFSLSSVSIYQHRGGMSYTLRVFGKSSCVSVLKHMLEAGLLVKRAQAELAMNLTETNYIKVREELAKLKGNQQWRYFLDSEGCLRARSISNTYRRLQRLQKKGDHRGVHYLQADLERQRRGHQLSNMQKRLSRMRDRARSMLRRGAVQNNTSKLSSDHCC